MLSTSEVGLQPGHVVDGEDETDGGGEIDGGNESDRGFEKKDEEKMEEVMLGGRGPHQLPSPLDR